MPYHYRLANPGITSISVNGQEHHVSDGVLQIADAHHTPAVAHEITRSFGGQAEPQNAEQNAQAADEEAERQTLFTWLDTALNRRIDRRSSVQQLRKLRADHERRQAAALAKPPSGPPATEAPSTETSP